MTTNNCVACSTDTDCGHLYNYPLFAACSAARTCQNCLGGCDDNGATIQMYQSGDEPSIVKLTFSKPMNVTAQQLLTVLNISIAGIDAKDYAFKLLKKNEFTFNLEFYPYRSLGVQYLNLNVLINAPVKSYIYKLQPIYTEGDINDYSGLSLTFGIITVSGLIFGIFILFVKKDASVFWAFISMLQTYFCLICFGCPMGVSIRIPHKWLSFPRIGWVPNIFQVVNNVIGDEIPSKFNFEAAYVNENILVSLGTILTVGLLSFFSFIALRILDQLMKRPELTRSIDKTIIGWKSHFLPKFYYVVYTDVVLAATVGLFSLNSDNYFIIIASNLCFFVIIMSFPGIILLFIYTRKNKDFSLDILGEFKSEGKGVRYAGAISLTRKFFVPFVIATSYNDPIAGLVFCLLFSIFYLCYLLKVKPFRSKKPLFIHAVTEVSFILAMLILVPGSLNNPHDSAYLNNLGIGGMSLCFVGLIFGYLLVAHEFIVLHCIHKLRLKMDPHIKKLQVKIVAVKEKFRDKSLDQVYIPEDEVTKENEELNIPTDLDDRRMANRKNLRVGYSGNNSNNSFSTLLTANTSFQDKKSSFSIPISSIKSYNHQSTQEEMSEALETIDERENHTKLQIPKFEEASNQKHHTSNYKKSEDLDPRTPVSNQNLMDSKSSKSSDSMEDPQEFKEQKEDMMNEEFSEKVNQTVDKSTTPIKSHDNNQNSHQNSYQNNYQDNYHDNYQDISSEERNESHRKNEAILIQSSAMVNESSTYSVPRNDLNFSERQKMVVIGKRVKEPSSTKSKQGYQTNSPRGTTIFTNNLANRSRANIDNSYSSKQGSLSTSPNRQKKKLLIENFEDRGLDIDIEVGTFKNVNLVDRNITLEDLRKSLAVIALAQKQNPALIENILQMDQRQSPQAAQSLRRSKELDPKVVPWK